MTAHRNGRRIDESLASMDIVSDLGKLVGDIYRKDGKPPVYLADEARCEYSKDSDLYNVKGVGVALCVEHDKKIKLVEWRGLVSYKNGIKAHWQRLLDDFTPMLLGDYTYGRETYVCPFIYPFIIDKLELMREDDSLRIDGCNKESTRARIDETIANIIECKDNEKFKKFHGKKDRAGDIAKAKIMSVDQDVIKRVNEMHMLYDIRFNSYLHH